MKKTPRIALWIAMIGATIGASLVATQSPSAAALIGSPVVRRAQAEPTIGDLVPLTICNNVSTLNDAFVPSKTPSFDPFTCYLRFGDIGDGVGQLQNTLDICYSENLTVDGMFGPLTEAALKRTQTKAGTTADGIYGPNTRRAILHQKTNGVNCTRVP